MMKVFNKKGLDIALSNLDELLLKAKKQPSEPILPPHPNLPEGARVIHSVQFTDMLEGSHSPAASDPGSKCADASCNCEHDEPWQSSDGALYLLTELCEICPKEVGKYLPQVAELTTISGFHHADCLKETIYECLPKMFRGVGKSVCKMNLELFYDGLFRAIKESKHNLASIAKECIKDIGKFIGPNILKGRLKEYREEYAKEYEQMMNE
jgi:hypothetical protein